MKDKLYDLTDKHHTLLGVCLFAGLFGIIFTSDNNQVAGSILLLLYLPAFCALMFYQLVSIDRSHVKARQRLQDQRNSASPHWDGQMRFSQDIEPRLRLLQARIEQDQQEVLELSRRIAKSDQPADSCLTPRPAGAVPNPALTRPPSSP
jgi:hypothetical protein